MVRWGTHIHTHAQTHTLTKHHQAPQPAPPPRQHTSVVTYVVVCGVVLAPGVIDVVTIALTPHALGIVALGVVGRVVPLLLLLQLLLLLVLLRVEPAQ